MEFKVSMSNQEVKPAQFYPLSSLLAFSFSQDLRVSGKSETENRLASSTEDIQ